MGLGRFIIAAKRAFGPSSSRSKDYGTHMAHVVKWSKPAYLIKIGRVLSRQESLKSIIRKPGCLLKDSLQDCLCRILGPSASHPTAYGKFVIDKDMKEENTQRRYFSANDPVPKSLVSRNINP